MEVDCRVEVKVAVVFAVELAWMEEIVWIGAVKLTSASITTAIKHQDNNKKKSNNPFR